MANGQSSSHSEGQQLIGSECEIVVGTNASKMFGKQILKQPANKLVLHVESKDESNIEQQNRTQDEISLGKIVFMENFMNGHFKSE